MYRWYQNVECCYVYLHDIPYLYLDRYRLDLGAYNARRDCIPSRCYAVEPRNATLPMHGATVDASIRKESSTVLSKAYDPAQVEIDLGTFQSESPQRWTQTNGGMMYESIFSTLSACTPLISSPMRCSGDLNLMHDRKLRRDIG